MTVSEIALASGLGRTTVANLCHKRSWAGVPIDRAVLFALACGINHMKMKYQRHYMRNSKKAYLREVKNVSQRKMFARLLATPVDSKPISDQRTAA